MAGEGFKALADPTRRRILELLKSGDLTAGELARNFDVSKPTLSHHLATLKAAGLVTDERHGQNIIYSLNTTVMQDLIGWFLGFKEDSHECHQQRQRPEPHLAQLPHRARRAFRRERHRASHRASKLARTNTHPLGRWRRD